MTFGMYSYTAFGLGIESELELPTVASGASRVDVRIRVGKVDEDSLPDTPRSVGFLQILAPEIYLSRLEEATYLVRNGNEIIVEPEPGAELLRIRVRVCTFGLAMLLNQRGYLVLHGNALAKGAHVVALLGDGGAGKSTLTMQLVQAGYTFIADDVLAIEIGHAGESHVLPGSPMLKLWSDALQQLGLPTDAAPHFMEGLDKRIWSLPAPEHEPRYDLSQIYLLEQGADIVIVRLEPKAASFRLLSNRYLLAHLDAVSPVRTFDQCVAVTKRVRICRLIRPKDFGRMSDVLGQIESDLTNTKPKEAPER